MNNDLTAAYYIWKREVTKFFRSKSRIIGSLGMPFFMLTVLGTGLNSSMKLAEVNGNYLEFITPGILSMVLLMTSVFSGVSVIMDRQFGFLKETLVAPVRRSCIVIGKSTGGATVAVFQGILMLTIAILMGVKVNLAMFPLAVLTMIIISVAFVSFGTAIASIIDDMHGFQMIMNFLVMPMFFLSGALFPLSSAPTVVRYLSYIDPVTYAVESLRFLLIGKSSIPIMVSFSILAAFIVVTTMLAAYLFSRIES